MVEFRIPVVIDPSRARRGARTVGRSLSGLENQADRLRATLSRAFAFVGVGLGVREIIGVADAYTQLRNRLRTVITDQNQLNATQTELFAIARRTRTEVGELANLYRRGSIAAQELGASNQELLTFTERVGQALAVQGGAVQESRGALRQLSQSLTSGIVRAEEFNSILEGAFPIAQAAARGIDEAGGSVARLRQLIITGQITSQEFFRGFLEGSGEIEARFQRTVPTIASAFVSLRNELTRIVGEFNDGSGAAERLARIILVLADNVEVVVRAVAGLGAVFATRAIVSGALALLNPFTALPALIALSAGALVGFGDQIALSDDGFVTLQTVAEATFELIKERGPDAIEVAIAAIQTFGDVAIRVFTETSTVIRARLDAVREFLKDNNEEATRAAARAEQAQLNIANTFGALGDTFASNLEAIDLAQIVDDKTNSFRDEGEQAFRFFEEGVGTGFAVGDLVNQGLIVGQETGEAVAEGIEQGFFVDRIIDRARVLGKGKEAADQAKIAAQAAAAAITGFDAPVGGPGPGPALPTGPDPFEGITARLEEDARLLRLSNREREIAIELQRIEQELQKEGAALTAGPGGTREQVENLLARNQALADQAEIVEQILGPQRQLEVAQAALSAAYREGQINLKQYEDALLSFQLHALEGATDAASGAERAFLRIQLAARDHAATVENTILTAYDAASDAIADFALSGFQDLHSLQAAASQIFAQIAADLAKLAVQQAITKIIPDTTQEGAAEGSDNTASTVSSILGILTTLIGGAAEGTLNARRGQPIVVGERGPELFRPRTSGTILPTEKMAEMSARANGGRGRSSPSINVSPPAVTVQIEATPNESFIQTRVLKVMDSSDGQKKMVENIGKNKRAVRQVTS